MDDTSLANAKPTEPATADSTSASGAPWPLGRFDRNARLAFDTPRLPEATTAWLHVVSAASTLAVARGTLELSGRFLADGHRVLIVDGGPRLKLHDRFDRDARWGVTECLTGELPVLGLVQELGRLGLYLLAHGTPARRTHWPQMGRLLEEARPFFGRAVLALQPDAPSAIGDALAGWHLEGWWAEPGKSRREATKLADRLRIHLSDLDLEPMPDAKLETLDVRLWTLTALGGRAGAALEPAAPKVPSEPLDVLVAPVAPPAPERFTTSAALASQPIIVEPAASVPAAVECDPRVRERLRFLLWMRRVHAEGARPETAPPPVPAGVAGA
jgi:hypothetical protein